MKIRRAVQRVSSFVARLGILFMKAVLTSAILGMVLVAVMHYMGVPIPSTHDLLHGVSRLAHVLS